MKKGICTIANDFQKTLSESNCKAKKIWVDKAREFYQRSVKSWPEKTALEMYSTHNKRKSVAAERIIRTLENENYK